MSSLRDNYGAIANVHTQPIVRFLTIGGEQIGVKNMNTTHPGPTDYYVVPDTDHDLLLTTLSINVGDTGSPGGFDFGNLSGGLQVGLRFFTERNGVLVYFPPFIENNQDVANLIVSKHVNSWDASVNRTVNYVQPVLAFSDGLPLRSATGDRFGVQLRDDLSVLPYLTVTVTGAHRLTNAGN